MKKLLFLGAIITFSMPALANTVEMQSFNVASYTFGVKNIKQEGNTVTFTIPEDARVVDTKTSGVVSGLYNVTMGKPSGACPFLTSYEVSKNIKNYNPLNGKADITAKFDKPEHAQAAVDNNCLIIDDTK